jgi:glutaredoxin
MENTTSWSHKIKEVLSYSLIVIVGLGIGLTIKYGIEKYNEEPTYIQTNTQAHFENSNNKVVIYTTQWCPYCKKAKQFLIQNNIAFTERDIEQGNKSIDALYATMESPGVPKIIIGNAIINGFNPSLIMKKLQKEALL